ncbi:MAG: gluconate 2-dehydrogenase subunit 3 family protein [Acidobacteriota bacterium]
MDAAQHETLVAIAARILPSEGDGIGAVEAGIADSLPRALGHPVYAGLRPHILLALERLDAAANERFGRDFVACVAAEQDAVLTEAEASSDVVLRLALRTLIHLTLEGLLGDPAHGGNRDLIGWRFAGYPDEEPRTGFCLHPPTETPP